MSHIGKLFPEILMMSSWRGRVLAAEPKKAGIASEDTLVSPPPAAMLDWH